MRKKRFQFFEAYSKKVQFCDSYPKKLNDVCYQKKTMCVIKKKTVKCFSTKALRVGVRMNFVQEEQQDPRCLLTTSAIYVLEDVSIHLDIATLDF